MVTLFLFFLSLSPLSLNQAETQKHEVCDELYELYGSLISQPQDTHNTHCFKSYFIVRQFNVHISMHTFVFYTGNRRISIYIYYLSRCLPERPEVFCTTVLDCHLSQGLERYITVKESTHIISAGTTGLTTWQARSLAMLLFPVKSNKQCAEQHAITLK